MKIATALVIGMIGTSLAAVVPASAGFRTPQSLVQNLYAFYGEGSPEYSHGLPHDAETARRFFQPGLARAWIEAKPPPFDFLVQAAEWKLGAVAITGTIKQFDRSYVRVAFVNQGKPVALNIVIVNGDEGWVISEVESAHDSLTRFLARLKEQSGKPRGKKPSP